MKNGFDFVLKRRGFSARKNPAFEAFERAALDAPWVRQNRCRLYSRCGKPQSATQLFRNLFSRVV